MPTEQDIVMNIDSDALESSDSEEERHDNDVTILTGPPTGSRSGDSSSSGQGCVKMPDLTVMLELEKFKSINCS